MWIVRNDVTRAVGLLQVCCEFDGGYKAAVHAMQEIFSRDEPEGVLLVDASNAFNSINMQDGCTTLQHYLPIIEQCTTVAQ